MKIAKKLILIFLIIIILILLTILIAKYIPKNDETIVKVQHKEFYTDNSLKIEIANAKNIEFEEIGGWC